MPGSSTFFYLSDPHLVNSEHDSTVGDFHKSGVVPVNEQTRAQDLLSRTLSEIGASEQQLDAIIINGDVATNGGNAGFSVLPGILSRLGDPARLGPRTVVVPGNHDVTRDTLPSSQERYQNFSNFVNENGYIAPALEGIHINPISGVPLDQSRYRPEAHYLLDAAQQWVIVPINCANYYGSLEPLRGMNSENWDALLALVDEGKFGEPQTARAYLTNLRRHDAARVADGQMAHVASLLNHVATVVRQDSADPEHTIKVAVIHHQLLPVSSVEEVKGFESLTNLGAFRKFLRDQGFHVVLHGHKHVGHTYWDHIYDFEQGASGVARRILVISGTSLRSASDETGEVCRLIELNPEMYVPTLQVRSVPLLRAGHNLRLGTAEKFALYDGFLPPPVGSANAYIIEGREAKDVYVRLMAFFDGVGSGEERYNLVCQVHEPTSLGDLADIYPKNISGYPTPPAEWFKETVDWWQHPTPLLGESVEFNHGGRIRNYRSGIDQLAKVKELLNSGGTTSRATITLLDPEDGGLDKKGSMPSFCVVQFIVRDSDDSKVLDCVGYFRKQEVRTWWPINLAELGRLQKEVFEEIAPAHRTKGLRLGTLTTVAAVAVKSAGTPRVAIPAIDRDRDTAPGRLLDLAYALYTPNMRDRSQFEMAWYGYLDDLAPPVERDEDGVPVALSGIHYLYNIALRMAGHHEEGAATQVTKLLGALLDENRRFAATTKFGTIVGADKQFTSWRSRVIDLLINIRTAVQEAFQSPSSDNSV